MIDCLISSGRSGVERIALDYALTLHMLCGGYVPSGFRTDDGVLGNQYREALLETDSADLQDAVDQNVKAADATLILVNYGGDLRGGELATLRSCIRNKKSTCVIDLTASLAELRQQVHNGAEWLLLNAVEVLHITGSTHLENASARRTAGEVIEAVLASAFMYLQKHPELQPNPNRFEERSWKLWNAQPTVGAGDLHDAFMRMHRHLHGEG